MAPRLGTKAPPNNVTKLPTRAAKGAGKSKPSAPAPKLKSPIPPGRPALKSEEKLRESLKLQIIGYTAQHRNVDEMLAVLAEEVKTLNGQKKQIRTAIRTAGMPLELFDESYKDQGTSRVDLDRKEKLRAIVREAHGLMVQAQGDLLDKVPEGERGAVYWEAQGYQDAIAGKFSDEGLKDCPPDHHQAYLKGHHNGTAANAAGIKAVQATAAATEGKVGPGQEGVIPEGDEDDDSDRDLEADGEKTDVEKALDNGTEAIDAEPPTMLEPGAPELDSAPQTEPAAVPSSEVLH